MGLRRELASCGLARAVKPRANRPDRNLESDRDLLVAEVGECVEQQRIPLPRAHRPESTRQLGVASRAVDPSRRLVLVFGPPVDTAAAVRAQLPLLGPPAAPEQVRRDPVQPRQGAVGRAAARTPLERDRERLRGQLVGELGPCASMQVAVDGAEMLCTSGPRSASGTRRSPYSIVPVTPSRSASSSETGSPVGPNSVTGGSTHGPAVQHGVRAGHRFGGRRQARGSGSGPTSFRWGSGSHLSGMTTPQKIRERPFSAIDAAMFSQRA